MDGIKVLKSWWHHHHHDTTPSSKFFFAHFLASWHCLFLLLTTSEAQHQLPFTNRNPFSLDHVEISSVFPSSSSRKWPFFFSSHVDILSAAEASVDSTSSSRKRYCHWHSYSPLRIYTHGSRRDLGGTSSSHNPAQWSCLGHSCSSLCRKCELGAWRGYPTHIRAHATDWSSGRPPWRVEVRAKSIRWHLSSKTWLTLHLRYYWKYDINVSRIESRPVKIDSSGQKVFDFFVDL